MIVSPRPRVLRPWACALSYARACAYPRTLDERWRRAGRVIAISERNHWSAAIATATKEELNYGHCRRSVLRVRGSIATFNASNTSGSAIFI